MIHHIPSFFLPTLQANIRQPPCSFAQRRERRNKIIQGKERKKTKPYVYPPLHHFSSLKHPIPSPSILCRHGKRKFIPTIQIYLFSTSPAAPRVYFPPAVTAAAAAAGGTTGAGVAVAVAVRLARRFDRSICVRMVLARYEMSRTSWM